METTAQVRDPVALDRSTLKLLCSATLLHFTVMGIYLAAIPLYVHDELGGSEVVVGLAVGSFFPAAVLFRPLIGRAIDRFGRRPFLIAAAFVVALTSGLFFLAGSIAMVAILRFIQGGAGAGFYSGAATVATDLAPEKRRAEVIAVFSLFLYAGIALGPAIGEWLVRSSGFHWAWAVAGVTSLMALLVSARLPETLQRGDSDAAERSRRSFLGLHRAALGPGSVLMLAAAGYSSITAFSPLYARAIGLSASGGLYATFAVTILGTRLFTRKLADRHGRATVALPGLIVAAAGLLLMATVGRAAAAYAGVAAYGAGFALIFPALMALTADRVGPSERGQALASFTVFFDIGAGIGSYVVGYLAGSYGFPAAYAFPAVLCAAGAVLLARRRSLRVA